MQNDLQVLRLSELEGRQPIQGATVRFAHSEHMTVSYWEFEAGALLPEHSHPHEQITSVIEGALDLTVEGHVNHLEAGMVVVVPPNARHSGKAISPCRVIDAFYPVREDFR